jgi:hypothetical protein
MTDECGPDTTPAITAPPVTPGSTARPHGAESLCPNCRKPIPDETVRCPHCHQWIIDRPTNETGRSPWFWPIVIAIGAAMILVVLVLRMATR